MGQTTIDQKTVAEVKKILWRHVDQKKFKAFIFGSRATGNAWKYSDVDLGIEGEEKLPAEIEESLDSAFDRSDLPIVVDVVDFKSVGPDFYRIAKQKVICLN